jgi:hypothetical protein
MAVPATLDLNITRGDTETIVVSLTEDDQTTPITITGRTYTAQLRTSPDIAIVSAAFVCTVTNGANGQVTCVMSATESAELKPGYYYWDLQENASGVISTVLRGTVTVDADVTR